MCLPRNTKRTFSIYYHSAVSIVIYNVRESTKNDKAYQKALKKNQPELTKYSSQPDLETKQMLELSDKDFRTAVISILKALIKNVKNMQDTRVISGEMKTVGQTQITRNRVCRRCHCWDSQYM